MNQSILRLCVCPVAINWWLNSQYMPLLSTSFAYYFKSTLDQLRSFEEHSLALSRSLLVSGRHLLLHINDKYQIQESRQTEKMS